MNVTEKITTILKEKLQPHAVNIAEDKATDYDYLPAVLLTCIEGNKKTVKILEDLIDSHNQFLKENTVQSDFLKESISKQLLNVDNKVNKQLNDNFSSLNKKINILILMIAIFLFVTISISIVILFK